MRLKTYERLQFLVGQGAVKKTITGDGKLYQGVAQAMRNLTTQLKASRAELVNSGKLKPRKIAVRRGENGDLQEADSCFYLPGEVAAA